MPIRFRCAYCNQLLGIARRKAGTVIRCPKCQGNVIVPAPEPEEGSLPPGESASHKHVDSRDYPTFDEGEIDMSSTNSLEAGRYPAGFAISPSPRSLSLGKLVLIGLLVFLLLLLAFTVGYLTGRAST